MARIGGGLFIGIALLCLIGPFFVSHSHETTQLAYGAQAPSWTHWFGTDELGRDILVRTLIGGRISIGVGFAATMVALLIGVVYGMIAGYYGGRMEAAMMRFVDTLYALPFTIIVILLTVLLGRSILLIFLAIGAVEWLTMARIVRGQTKALRKQTFVDAAIVAGVPNAAHTRKAYFAESFEPCDRIYNADDSCGDFIGISDQLPRTRRTTSDEFVGNIDQRGCRENRYLPVDADLPCAVFLADDLRAQLCGRRPA
jgi:ABC-type dipeptide/oligopeptide/nickel transport system permease subunit